MEKLVSIIMPAYNSAGYIAESIRSVLSQTYKNWELLITDDCSKDSTVSIVKDFVCQDNRIRLFVQDKNQGSAAARNRSIGNAKGKYIAFLDSDDIWNPDKLEKQLSFMETKDIPFSFSKYEVINQDGTPTNKMIDVPNEITYSQLLKNTIIGCLTVVIDKDKVGAFNMPNFKTGQDWATWLSVLKRGFVAYGIHDCLAKYRLVSTSNTSKKIKVLQNIWKIYRQSENLSVIKSAFCFCNYAFNAIRKRL